ncbi:MAG: hypothetical protein EBT92_10110 [Planctomycetes bacterium]|nr:hypothetical protein [Planctomycetota bacterium]NBY02589.1 hypothetical protein [Planctomycetota bacterium]
MLVNHERVRRFPVLFLLILSFLLSAGCRSSSKRAFSYYPLPSSRWTEQTEKYLVSRKLPSKLSEANPRSLLEALREKNLNLTDLESMMELSFEKADLTDDTDIYAGVEYYAYAACFAWRILDREGLDNPNTKRASEIYQSCLARVLEDGTKDNGFQVHGHWCVHEKISSFPVYAHGFPNRTHLFRNLTVPKNDTNYNLSNYYVRKGAGLPVIFHPDAKANSSDPLDIYHNLGHPMSATILILPNDNLEKSFCKLEVVNSRAYSSIKVNGKEIPLAGDFSAAYQEMLERDLSSKLWIMGFLDGDRESKFQGLYMAEPYNPDKIPVIFVHGLLSTPATWMETMNELDQIPGIRERYQFWFYMYPTAGSILLNGTDLRENLQRTIHQLDPKNENPALKQMVLIGHSMGGLLSRLQVVHSDDKLYSGLCKVPFNELQGKPTVLELARKTLFFEPNPNISHVVYIGTPHNGSPLSFTPTGRLGSLIAHTPSWQKNFRSELNENNPSAFLPAFKIQSQPNSIDMLGFENPFLKVFQTLRPSEQIQVHSIAGDMNQLFESRKGDSVVPLSSALAVKSDTVTIVQERHMELHHHPKTITEITRILQQNITEADALASNPK